MYSKTVSITVIGAIAVVYYPSGHSGIHITCWHHNRMLRHHSQGCMAQTE